MRSSRNYLSRLGIIVLAALVMAPSVAQGVPTALCVVPAKGAEHHVTYSGAEITLKGIARGNAVEYQWDFGDGEASTGWLPIENPYDLSVKHTYFGHAEQPFTAVLRVRDIRRNENADEYNILILESSDLTDRQHMDVRIKMAIDEGLWYLYTTMDRDTYSANAPGYSQPYGYWKDRGGYPLAATGAALNTFHLAGHRPNKDYDADPYVETVQRAINYILHDTRSETITDGRAPENPDTNGNNIGLVAYPVRNNRETYIGGICMVAIASSAAPSVRAAVGGPHVLGRTYAEILQDMVDFFAWGQVDSGAGQGGWRYWHNYGNADMSTTQWPPLAMLVAEGFNWELDIPEFVGTELVKFLNRVQVTAEGDDNGAFLYRNPGEQYQNLTKQGIGLLCHRFAGTPLSDPRVQSAIGFIYRHWGDTGSSWTYTRLFGNSYGMYAIMKGFVVWPEPIRYVTEYRAGRDRGTFDWFYTPAGQEQKGMATYIIENQQADGSWDDTVGGNKVYDAFCTGWTVAILLEHVGEIPPKAVICDCSKHHYLENQDIALDGSCSYHPNPAWQIVSYEWDFDYDQAGFDVDATGPTAVIEGGFPSPGSYWVALRVKDNQYVPQQDIETCEIIIPNHCPVAAAHPDRGERVYRSWPGEPVLLDGSASYDPDNDVIDWDWDLDNDGLFGAEDDDCFGEPSDGVGETLSWSWNDPGVYTIGLRVTDASAVYGSCSDFDYAKVEIGNHAPTACITRGGASPGQNCALPGEVVELCGLCSSDLDPGDEILGYAWDLNDDGLIDSGEPCVDKEVDPDAEEGSLIRVKLKVMDSYGEWSEFVYYVIEVGTCCTNILKLDTNTGAEPLYIKTHEIAQLNMKALGLCQPVFACQALLSFDPTFFITADAAAGSPQVVAGDDIWNELIYQAWTPHGDLDLAVGVDMNEPDGTIDDGTVAAFGLTSNGTEGVTSVTFRPDVDEDWSTFLVDTNVEKVYPEKIDSQNIVIDGTSPCIKIVSIGQDGVEIIGTDISITQGHVQIAVEAGDALAGLAGVPDVNFGDIEADYTGETPGGDVCGHTFNYEVEITACEPPDGEYEVTACATDRAGNTICDTQTVRVNTRQIAGTVALEGLTPPAGGLTRSVTFVATGASRQQWTVEVHFAEGSSTGNYTLTDVPADTTALSAKTAWNLRSRQDGLSLDACGQLTVDFVGDEHRLLAGDARYGIVPDDNIVNIVDYGIMVLCVWTDACDAADWNGDGKVDHLDLELFENNYFKQGDPE